MEKMEGWEISFDPMVTEIVSWVETSAAETSRMICAACRARYSASYIAGAATCSTDVFPVTWILTLT